MGTIGKVLIVLFFTIIFSACELREKAKEMKEQTSFDGFILECRKAARVRGFNPIYCGEIKASLMKEAALKKKKFNYATSLKNLEKQYIELKAEEDREKEMKENALIGGGELDSDEDETNPD